MLSYCDIVSDEIKQYIACMHLLHTYIRTAFCLIFKIYIVIVLEPATC